MRATKPSGPWVIYQMSVNGNVMPGNAVCDQQRWEELEESHPGQHVLIHGGIATEAEAERLARGTAGDKGTVAPKKLPRKAATATPIA